MRELPSRGHQMDECGIRYCVDFDDVPGKPKCCGSCHDDSDLGSHELMERFDNASEPAYVTHIVCCVVDTWLDGRDSSATAVHEGDSNHG